MPSIILQIRALLVKNFTQSFRNKEYISDLTLPVVTAIIVSLKDQLEFLGFFAPLFLSIAVSTPPRSLLINLVEEKSERFKESQKIMGMKQRSYLIGWILYGYIKTLMSTIFLIFFWWLLTLIINDGNYGFNIESYKIFLTYFLYSSTVLNFSLAMSTVFSSPKLANEVSTFVTILSILLTFLVFLSSIQSSSLFYYCMSIFPQSSISFIYMGALKRGFFNSQAISSAYPLSNAALQLGIESVLYFILFFYLDQVFPNEYGVSKHPLFFLQGLFGGSKKNKLNDSLLDEDYTHTQNGDYSSAIYHQKLNIQKKCTVSIKNLTKKFGDFKAVDNLTIKLYEQEILCLLGHNGAGKTTTISMLTGMIQKTKGTIEINGIDLEENIDAIRENVGICTQRDVLYVSLKVIEMLIFMGRVKGLEGLDLQQEINEIIEVTELEEDRDKLIKELSGGSKRKLSLAIALIGGSSVIFLDEPTSGMDAQSRRIIWEILQKVRQQNRTLILTTHHLDEAEVLADRITIMAAGKLLACGKCDYIKTNFGEGYHLSITSQNQKILQACSDQVLSIIQEAQNDPQSQSDTRIFLIPFKSKPKLDQLIGAITKQFQNEIVINLKLNSLEDAFINIGMDEEKFIKKAKGSKASVNDSEIAMEQEVEQQRDIKIPKCLNDPPVYSFKQQFTAIFLRKFYTTSRTFSNYISIVIPFTLIVIGTLIIDEINLDFLKDDKNLEQYFKLVLISLFVILAFCFNSSLFITLPVLEREFNLKYALTVMGCRVLPYWIGTYAFDFLLYSFFVITFVIFSYIMQLSFVTDHMGYVVFAFVTFGFAYISFSYFAGILIYKKTSTAMKTFPFLNFFIVYCMPQNFWGICALLWQKEIGSPALIEFLIKSIECIFSFLSPFFAFQRAFQNIIKIDVTPNNNQPPPLTTETLYYSIAMFYQGIIFFILTLYLEGRQFKQVANNLENNDVKRSVRVDQQVIDQEQNLLKSNDPVKMYRLQKVYENGCVALQNVSVSIQKQKILGLLGPNGSGKSTIFNILTSLINKSGGQVKIKNQEVHRGKHEVFQDVGICPQFDCIWENLTPNEHLYLFGRMKGLSGADLSESVTYFLQTMQLEEYINRESGRLSGGNKRKLCVSNALIGGPCIQFFDEPSTGVDPIARRFLWRTLKLGVQLRQSSVMLTTHTMDEAENLCDKIAILVKGQVYCLGSPQELRIKYGDGYDIQLREYKNRQEITQFLNRQFQNITEIIQKDQENLQFHIPSQSFDFSKAYFSLTELVQKQLIHDFSINQSSLESVFLQFSKSQQDQYN
ncbi:unnamed protein product (macronuclear) [Paramecium tetraurelia]|uniref:ATP-binding cassette transporter, putative n=1 Tax=Paramecium tetraurelia TaxID=5888 RepID=Q6BFG8_PARTE|nr:ATP-binding cassette transporter [Paramecium tetraurelia strain d4-2]XP_001423041.1 uncharacterized protein GSPATT00000078001 [Paramecium tetraurelia]CAH03602.1 ATP-binding cassette transporter, putative [Paramecium tetraurelia]CAK55643.1 unnamed protein product [Paramecium tetraurelia]|eukprot:XP_001423041.1 hypothetical protein (macronuclear) [Paramecium tetraurelia strain d4-2]